MATTKSAGQDTADDGHDDDGIDHDMLQHCIEECLNCHATCTATAQYCLSEGGPLADADHVGLLLDCAEICQTSANFMLRGSDLHTLTCGVCAEVCARCAEECERMADDDVMPIRVDARAALGDVDVVEAFEEHIARRVGAERAAIEMDAPDRFGLVELADAAGDERAALE